MAKLGTFVANQVLSSSELNAMGGAYTSYTPTWTGITTGNGTNSGGYVVFGRTVFWYATFVLGTTSAITGNVIVSLPPGLTMANDIARNVMLLDSPLAWYSARFVYATPTTAQIEVLNSSTTYLTGTSLTSTIPFTWTTSDAIYVSGVYNSTS